MKSWLKYIEEKTTTFKDVVDWVEPFEVDVRAPSGLKKQFEKIKWIKNLIKVDRKYKFGVQDSYQKMAIEFFDGLTPAQKQKFEQKMSKEKNILEIKGKYATYIKKDTSSQSKFKSAVKELESFLSTFKGIYAKGLKNLVIHFVSAKGLKAKASYRPSKDVIRIRLSAMGKSSDGYGSLKYVIIHELFHRMMYNHIIKPKFNIDSYEWTTTPYSMVDSFSGEEKGAEIFALNFFKEKYPQYQEKIDKFMKELKK